MAKKIDADADEKILNELAYQAAGDLSPIAAVLGGFVAQEVLKAVSSKFHPMVQHMYFDSLESLPSTLPTEADCAPTGSRYDGQIAVFGKTFQEKIANHRQFLVGAGAIGCEMLKNWSMLGLASGPQGIIHVTDLDTIEKSNLNRQFLFRPKDLGKFKSEVAAAAVVGMNPDLQGKILAKQEQVGPTTESQYLCYLVCDIPSLSLTFSQTFMTPHSLMVLKVSLMLWITSKLVSPLYTLKTRSNTYF